MKHCKSNKDVRHRVPNQPGLYQATVSQTNFIGNPKGLSHTIAMYLSVLPLAKLPWINPCDSEPVYYRSTDVA